ncbi:hypothetical protein ABC347_10870 [Sphingomonas sp. 1P06PA]|uniref:hypothetical protein n=1 Tax=Sphingomonas sp. 1P06PA TaxID=554121 RepID=UPI0039A66614
MSDDDERDVAQMLPIERLSLVRQDQIAPGGLMIVDGRDKDMPPAIAVLFTDEDNTHRRFHLALSAEGKIFPIQPSTANGGLWLVVDEWTLIVDPVSSYLALGETPRAGDAFISDGVPGIVGRWDHATGYISTNGVLLPEPKWGSGYVGFRSWRIIIKRGVEEPMIIYERSRNG